MRSSRRRRTTEQLSKTVSGGTFWCRRFASWLRVIVEVDFLNPVVGFPRRGEGETPGCHARGTAEHFQVVRIHRIRFWHGCAMQSAVHDLVVRVAYHQDSTNRNLLWSMRPTHHDDVTASPSLLSEQTLLPRWWRIMVDAESVHVIATTIPYNLGEEPSLFGKRSLGLASCCEVVLWGVDGYAATSRCRVGDGIPKRSHLLRIRVERRVEL